MLAKPRNIHAIPGWGFDATIFNEISSSKLNFIGLSYIGYQTLLIDEIASAIAAKIPEKSILLGWSFGGVIAIKLAAQYPAKVRQLILLSSQPKLCDDCGWHGISQANAGQFVENFKKMPQQQMKGFARLVCYPSRSINLRQIIQNHMVQQKHEELFYLLKMLFGEDLRDEYRKLDIDILHVFCDQDAILPQSAGQLRKLNKRTKTVSFKNAGHADFLISPSKYLMTIEKLINHA